eukprot:UN23545
MIHGVIRGKKYKNDENSPVATGTGEHSKHNYYCGKRKTFLDVMGYCGPNNGPQCDSCKRFQTSHRGVNEFEFGQYFYQNHQKIISTFKEEFFIDVKPPYFGDKHIVELLHQNNEKSKEELLSYLSRNNPALCQCCEVPLCMENIPLNMTNICIDHLQRSMKEDLLKVFDIFCKNPDMKVDFEETMNQIEVLNREGVVTDKELEKAKEAEKLLPTFKIVVLGGGATGKSSLVIRYISGHTIDMYDPTIEDEYTKLDNVDGYPLRMNILDTAGQEEFVAMQDQWIREGQGFLLVYNVNSSKSFDEVQMLRDKIVRTKETDQPPIVLVGTQLYDDESKRSVSTSDGQKLSKEWKCPFIETSAESQPQEVFHEIVRQIRKKSES